MKPEDEAAAAQAYVREIKAAAVPIKAAATARMRARWTPPRFETTNGPLGPARTLTDGSGELAAVSDVAAWFDEVISRSLIDGAGAALIFIIEAARKGGARLAAAAVAVAERLVPWDQAVLYGRLSALTGGRQDVAEVLSAVDSEWKQLHLHRDVLTAPTPRIETTKPKFNSEAGGEVLSPFAAELKELWQR